MKNKKASPEAVLELSVAAIDLYFRLEAATAAIAGFPHAGGEWGVLRSLVLQGDQTVPDMARARPITRQHCQTIVNSLHEQGLVNFVENPRHKRSHLVTVTKKGRARYEALSERFLGAAATFTHMFEADEVATTIDVLRRARSMLAT